MQHGTSNCERPGGGYYNECFRTAPICSEVPSMASTAGAQLGRYRLIERIGAGGMGEVFLAHDPQLDRRVALKLLPARLAGDGLARERLRREALAAAALDHPFICKIFEI